jgi:hypothetical protein
MAGAAIGAVASPRAADFRNRRRFIDSVSLRWPVVSGWCRGLPIFCAPDLARPPLCDADYRDSLLGGN